MKHTLKNMLAAGIAGIFTLSAGLLPVSESLANQKDWRFKVFLDNTEIGYHHFTLSQQGTQEQLTAEANFKVSFLKIPLFSYSHNNTEIWQRQCLKNIASSTDENGKMFRVEGSAQGETFRLDTQSGETTLPACVSTFAYWDKSFLQRKQLLNSQTGEYLDVQTVFLGEQSILVGNTDIPARRYQLSTGEADIDLWYSQDDQWLALESITESGRVLRYVIE